MSRLQIGRSVKNRVTSTGRYDTRNNWAGVNDRGAGSRVCIPFYSGHFFPWRRINKLHARRRKSPRRKSRLIKIAGKPDIEGSVAPRGYGRKLNRIDAITRRVIRRKFRFIGNPWNIRAALSIPTGDIREERMRQANVIAINAIRGVRRLAGNIRIEAQISENASADPMPFVPEGTAKECSEKPRRGIFAREYSRR